MLGEMWQLQWGQDGGHGVCGLCHVLLCWMFQGSSVCENHPGFSQHLSGNDVLILSIYNKLWVSFYTRRVLCSDGHVVYILMFLIVQKKIQLKNCSSTNENIYINTCLACKWRFMVLQCCLIVASRRGTSYIVEQQELKGQRRIVQLKTYYFNFSIKT